MPADSQLDSFDYSPHALRLDGRDWLIVLAVVLLFAFLAPRVWTRVERLQTNADYRIPYALSDDYWLYHRRLQEAASDQGAVFVIGDSVIWGEYVRSHGTLSHFLNEGSKADHRFVNAGVNGLFPLALEGLVRDFARPVRNRKVILHANLLWMTSAEADLSTKKEQAFNHQALVPQFSVKIPSFRAPMDRRLSHLANRKATLFSWSKHLQIAYFDQLSIPAWTLERGNDCKNPLAQVTRNVPGEPSADPARGEESPRHKPWSDGSRRPQSFAWVSPEDSLQFAAFQRIVTLLKKRGNDVLVVIGPLNAHMVATESRPPHEAMQGALRKWLDKQQIPNLTPDVLPSNLYGDASHPLTSGYRELARDISRRPEFVRWLKD